MKRTLFAAVCKVLAAVVILTSSSKTDEQFIWPVKGAEPGTGILSRPQQYIGTELNFSDLYISAEEGSEIVAPCDGIISRFGVIWFTAINKCMASTGHRTLNEGMAKVRESAKLQVNPKYVTGEVTIKTEDGRHINIIGICGDIEFKTGMKISKGDVIGTAGYAYKEFETPHICISISSPKGKTSDPMSPFGLETTYVAPEELVLPETLTAEQAAEDFTILMDAYKELFPSLDDIVTPELFEAFKISALEEMKDGMSYTNFYKTVRRTTSSELVHDSHISLLSPDPRIERLDGSGVAAYVPNLMPGIINDTIFVTQATRACSDMVGKRVVSIDDRSAAEVISDVEKMITGYDGDNRSYRDYMKLRAWNYIYDNEVSKPRTSIVRFEDGTEYEDIWFNSARAFYTPVLSTRLGYYKRMYEGMENNWSYRELNDSTGLLSIHTFVLNDIELEEMADTVSKASDKANMIIDVRFNGGGQVPVMNRIISMLTDEYSATLNPYSKVNSNSTFESFRHCTNYTPDMKPFEDFKEVKGKKGFYADSQIFYDQPTPDSLVNYSGRLYILTDETSVSAATYFPAFLVRNHRAVTVGRETKTGYHYMTAIKFADILLPNSKIQVRIPLVKDVFDDVVTSRTPYGRGLLPDYEVPLTYEELYTAVNDPVLDKALELIAEGKYLGENPFTVIEKDKSLIFTALSIGVVGFILLIIFGYRKRRH